MTPEIIEIEFELLTLNEYFIQEISKSVLFQFNSIQYIYTMPQHLHRGKRKVCRVWYENERKLQSFRYLGTYN